MQKFLLCLLLFISLAARAEDLSEYKTADALWAHLDDQTKSLSEGLKQQDPVITGLIPQIWASAKEFIARYPKDERIWDAKMLIAQTGSLTVRLKLPIAPSKAKLTQEFTAIADDKDAPKAARAAASGFLINDTLDQAFAGTGDSGAAWDAADARIADFQKQFGNDFTFDGAHSAIAVLRMQELQALKLSNDPARYQAVLQKLSADTQLQVAQMASDQLAEIKKVAALKTKPLDLKFTAVNGTPVDLASLRGKVVLIDFWATWCAPCVAKMPTIVAAYQKYHHDGLEVIGISLDQDKATMLAFTKAHDMPWPQYFDGQGFDNAISHGFGIDSIPEVWLVDKKGMLVATDVEKNLAGQVEKLLQAP